MKMTNSNKITNTKVGDDIHFYVNGSEDRGIVVKMNNEYVTVFKESTQEYDDIHINDTFFIKDILVNKEWDKMDDDERYDALTKIHAPSPRFIMKSWYELPKEIKELLTKNNAIETAHKEGKDDDMNNTTRVFDDSKKTLNQTASGKVRSRLNAEGKVGEKIEEGVGSKPKGGEEEALDAGSKIEPKGYQKNPEAITQHQRPEEFRSIDNEKGEEKGTKDTTTNFMTEGGDSIGAGEHKLGGQSLADAQEVKFGKQQGRKEQGKKDDEVTAGVSALKAWQLWLAKREQEVLKIHEIGEGDKQSDFQWHKGDSSKLLRTDQSERTSEGKVSGLSDSSQKYEKEHAPLGRRESDNQRVGRADTMENRPTNEYNKDRKIKSWESWLEYQKSNTERSIHGNAGREPNSGVNTNTGFDASEDYEGFSHSGLRPEQFKHEKVKPKVTTKERINIGTTNPSKPSAGTGDGGNPYDTKTGNKDVKGRAVAGKDKK